MEGQSGAGKKEASQHSRSKVSKSLPLAFSLSGKPDNASTETRQKEGDWHNNIATGWGDTEQVGVGGERLQTEWPGVSEQVALCRGDRDEGLATVCI